MAELKNCPFCGGVADIQHKGGREVIIGCLDCDFYFPTDINTYFTSTESAIKFWNTRPPSSSNGLDKNKIRAIIYMELDHEDTYKDLDIVENQSAKNCFNAISEICSDAICQEFKQTSVPDEAPLESHEIMEKSDSKLWEAIINFYPAFQGNTGQRNKEALYQWIIHNVKQTSGLEKLRCPKCDGAEIKPEDLTSYEIHNVLETYAEQFGWSKCSPAVPSEEYKELLEASKEWLQWFEYLSAYQHENLVNGQTLESASENWNTMTNPSPPIDRLRNAIRKLILNKGEK